MNKVICEMVAERIIEQLKQGVVPWQKPWVERYAVSHDTGKEYSLLNQMLLGEAGEYITFKQCEAEKGKVKKGAKSRIVVYWNMIKKEEEKDGEIKVKTVPILKYYRVFNVNDCEGIEHKFLKEGSVREHDSIKEAEDIVEGYKARNNGLKVFEVDSESAYYSASKDRIVVPKREQFRAIGEFYSTLFHEMVHSTGHESRLNRLNKTESFGFGSDEYGKEELVAECGAAMLSNMCGITDAFDNSVAYIGGWIKAISEKPEIVVTAAGKAEKAVGFIMGQ